MLSDLGSMVTAESAPHAAPFHLHVIPVMMVHGKAFGIQAQFSFRANTFITFGEKKSLDVIGLQVYFPIFST